MSTARKVYSYFAPDNGDKNPADFLVIDIDENARCSVMMRGAGEISTMALPYEQLAQMLYRLRDERRMHVMSVIAAEKETAA